MNKKLEQYIEKNKNIVNKLDTLNSKKEEKKAEYKPIGIHFTYDKYISNNKEIVKCLESIMRKKDKPTKTLVLGPAGAGKTNVLSKCFDELIAENKGIIIEESKNDDKCEQLKLIEEENKTKDNKKEKIKRYKENNKVYSILCPNRVQNVQNAGDKYKFKALVKGTKVTEIDEKISAVYEKANELATVINFGKQVQVVAVDESHQLTRNLKFRDDALEQIDFLETVANTVFHVTATPEACLCNKYDYIIWLEDVNYSGNVEKIEITQSSNPLETLNTNFKKYENNLTGINNLDYIKDMEGKYDDIGIITGLEEHKSNNNEAYTEIINHERLVKSRNLFSSSGYCGTNIVDYSDDLVLLQGFESPYQTNIDDIIQFTNRVRIKKDGKKVGLAKIIIGQPQKEEKKFMELLDILDIKQKEAEYMLRDLKLIPKAFLLKNHNDKEKTKKELEYFLNYKDLENNKKNNLGCIKINDNLEFYIDKKLLFKSAYDFYNSQFFYNAEKLKEKLEEELNTRVEITDAILNETREINTETKEIKEERMRRAKAFIKDNSVFFKKYLLAETKIKDEIEKKASKNEIEALNYVKRQEKVLESFKYLLKTGNEFDFSLKFICKMSKYSDVDNYLRDKQIMLNNKYYINGQEEFMVGKIGGYQKILIKMFLNQKITVAKVKNAMELGKKYGYKFDITKEKDTKRFNKILDLIFNIGADGKYRKCNSLAFLDEKTGERKEKRASGKTKK